MHWTISYAWILEVLSPSLSAQNNIHYCHLGPKQPWGHLKCSDQAIAELLRHLTRASIRAALLDLTFRQRQLHSPESLPCLICEPQRRQKVDQLAQRIRSKRIWCAGAQMRLLRHWRLLIGLCSAIETETSHHEHLRLAASGTCPHCGASLKATRDAINMACMHVGLALSWVPRNVPVGGKRPFEPRD